MVKRIINENEFELLEWLINNSDTQIHFDISNQMIVYECTCGCSSFDFIDKSIINNISMNIISDWYWKTPEGYLNGVYLYLIKDQLGGVDIYSLDGKQEIRYLPNIIDLFTKK